MAVSRDAETLESHRSPLPRRRVGPFELDALIGEGGMAVVFRGHTSAGRPVAIKVIRATLVGANARRRFQREAAIRLEHPNVVEVVDAGVDDDGTPYIAFELLEGRSLATILDQRSLGVVECVELALQLCDGLSAVHRAGLVHRDLKPANLFLTDDGVLKILDFGVAHVTNAETQLTLAGNVVGTPSYLAPEQARGDPDHDPRVDVFSTGAVLYEALVGTPPFERDTALATMLATLLEPLTPPSSLIEIPAALEEIICRALEKERSKRWQSIDALHDALASVRLENKDTLVGTAPTRAASVVSRDTFIQEGERRVVVVLVATGVTDRLALAASVEDQGGELVPIAGDRAVGLFGHRRWEGDEIVRAARAAVDARAAALQMGLASGHASQSEGALAGDAVRRAEEAASQGLEGIAIGPELARSLGGRMTVLPAADGWLELTLESSVAPFLEREVELVGRADELAYVDLTLELAKRRAIGLVVEGPPGIGKTRVFREACARARRAGFTVLSAAGEGHLRERSFALLSAMVRGYLLEADVERAAMETRLTTLLGDTAERAMPFLGEILGLEAADSESLRQARSDPQLMHDHVRLAFADLVEAVGRRAPVLIGLEDAHWIDRASMEVLDDIGHRRATDSIAFLVSARPELLESNPRFLSSVARSVLPLEGLTRDEIRALWIAVTDRVPGDEELRRIAERTAGNPLFVEQIVTALPRVTADEALPMPLTVEAAVQSRIDQLPADEKDLLKRAAIYEPPFREADLRALQTRNVDRTLRRLSQRRLLVRELDHEHGAGYRFANQLVASVASGMLAEPVAQALHALAGEHLAARSESDAWSVGRHFELAGRTEEASAHYARAVVDAGRRGHVERVLVGAERLAELGIPDELAYEIHVARADALRFRGDRAAQRSALDEALTAARTAADRARALVELVSLAQRSEGYPAAVGLASRAVQDAKACGVPEVLALALAKRSTTAVYGGDLDSAENALREAEALGRDFGPRTLAALAAARAELTGARGELGGRAEAFREVVAQNVRAGDLRRAAGAENNLADMYNRVGMYEEAVASLEEALERGRRLGFRLLEGYASVNLAYALDRLDRSEAALERLAAAETIAVSARDRRLELTARIYAIRAQLSLGRRSTELLTAARGIATEARRDAPAVRASALVQAARAALELDAVDDAVDASTTAMRIRDELGGLEEDEAELFVTHAKSLLRDGRADEAAAVHARGAARVREIAAGIHDAAWRARFLDVESNRELLRAAEADR